MPYRLHNDEQVQDGLRRCAREQLDRAIEDLTAGVRDDPVNGVHSARKALKRTRSLLRLARGTIDRDERRMENAALRHAALTLSAARDAEVTLQALDDLSDRFAGRVPQTTFDAIRARLAAERDPARQRLLESGLTEEVADELKAVRTRVDEWSLQRDGWQALEPGLLRSYRRRRAAFKRVRREPSTENLHEWRKRAKDLWYHLRILRPLSPGVVAGQADEAHTLSDRLGDDHDLALLRAKLGNGAGDLRVDLDPVFELIDRRRVQLQSEAVLIGARLYAERPKHFVRRIHRYWKAWRSAGAPRPAALA